MARLMNKEWHMYGMQAYRLERLSGRIRLRMHASGRCGQELLASEHSSLHAKAEKALPHDIFDSLASAPAQTARHIGVVVWAEQALPLFAARLYTASSCSLLGYTHLAELVLRTWGLLLGHGDEQARSTTTRLAKEAFGGLLATMAAYGLFNGCIKASWDWAMTPSRLKPTLPVDGGGG